MPHEGKEENVYLNVTVHNNTENNVYARYEETRSQPILNDPDEYEMSIIRFDIPSTAIPKFKMDQRYSVTLVYPAENLVSEQVLQLYQVSYASNVTGDSSEYIWAFKQMVISTNDALALAYADIVAQYEVIHGGGSWAGSGGPQSQPYLEYDPSTKLFTFYCPTLMADSSANRIELWMNNLMYKLFETFLFIFYGYTEPDGMDVRIVIRNFLTNSATISGINYYKMTQEYSSLPAWYVVYKIVIVSNTILSRKEFISFNNVDPIKLDPFGNPLNVSLGTANTLGIVQDFDYSFFQPNIERITYLPTAEYRWVDLLAHDALYKVDFQVLVQAENGELIPLVLEPGDNVNIKFLFRKRSQYRA